MKFTLAFALAASLTCSLHSAQTVHVVDTALGPLANFTSIQDAVDAASEEDIILVRTAVAMQDVLIDGKSLTLVGDDSTTGDQAALSHLSICNLNATQRVAVRNFSFVDRSAFIDDIELNNNMGQVWLEDFSNPTNILPFSIGFERMTITDCSTVVLVRLTLLSTTTQSPYTFKFTNSNVTIHDSHLEGKIRNIVVGDSCLEVTGGNLGIYDSLIQGGYGNQAGAHNGQGPGESGLTATGTNIEIQDSMILSGVGNSSTPAPTILTNSTQTDLTSDARSFQVDSPVRGRTTVTINALGMQNDRVWVYYSLSPGVAFQLPVFDVPYLLGGPLNSLYLGQIPASGTLSMSFPAPAQGAGMDGFTLFVQPLFLDSNGQGFVFGEPTVVPHLAGRF